MAVSMFMDVLAVAVRAEEADEPADLEQQPDLIDEAVGRVYYFSNIMIMFPIPYTFCFSCLRLRSS